MGKTTKKCPACGGSGTQRYSACNGRGRRTIGFWPALQKSEDCLSCNTTGKVSCNHCGGKGEVEAWT